MPSKTSKTRPTPRSPSKSAPGCSETKIGEEAILLALQLKPGDRVLLEGPLGAGKTFFARALLKALKVHQPPEGSPSFAIAHEYAAPVGRVVHVDFYRIRGEEEIEEAGIPAYFWDENCVVISEWTSLWPEFEAAVLRDGRTWIVHLAFEDNPDVRTFQLWSP